MKFEKRQHNQFLVSTDDGAVLGQVFSTDGQSGWKFDFLRGSVPMEFHELREVAAFVEGLENGKTADEDIYERYVVRFKRIEDTCSVSGYSFSVDTTEGDHPTVGIIRKILRNSPYFIPTGIRAISPELEKCIQDCVHNFKTKGTLPIKMTYSVRKKNSVKVPPPGDKYGPGGRF